jgi:hypothetical protein
LAACSLDTFVAVAFAAACFAAATNHNSIPWRQAIGSSISERWPVWHKCAPAAPGTAAAGAPVPRSGCPAIFT